MGLVARDRWQRWQATLRIAWPLIISNSFWNLQLTIDRVFLSHYSTEALGASMAVAGVFWTPMALLQQTAAYLATFVAQYYGAKRFSMIGPATWQALHLSVLGGGLFLLLIPAARAIFGVVGHSPTMQQLEIEFFQAICWSALPTATVAAASGFLSGLGQTQRILWLNGIGFVLNGIFDYLLIFGHLGFPALGIAGAGYATTIASYGAALAGLLLMFYSRHDHEYGLAGGWRWQPDLLKRYLRFGVPSGLQWALEGLAFSVFLIFVGRMPQGDAALASSSIVVTVMMLSILPALGVAQAVAIQVGQFLGERRPALAVASTWSGLELALFYIIIMSASFLFFPRFYLSWFYHADDAALWEPVSVMVPYLLMFVAFFTCFDCLNLICSFALKGAGDTRYVSLVALTLPWPLMVLPTWLMRDWPGSLYWAWAAASVFSMTQGLIFLRRFVGGKWQSMSVIA